MLKSKESREGADMMLKNVKLEEEPKKKPVIVKKGGVKDSMRVDTVTYIGYKFLVDNPSWRKKNTSIEHRSKFPRSANTDLTSAHIPGRRFGKAAEIANKEMKKEAVVQTKLRDKLIKNVLKIEDYCIIPKLET